VFENQSGFVFAGFYNETNVVFPLTDSEVFEEEIIFVQKENTKILSKLKGDLAIKSAFLFSRTL
jgi:hypothetical protein